VRPLCHKAQTLFVGSCRLALAYGPQRLTCEPCMYPKYLLYQPHRTRPRIRPTGLLLDRPYLSVVGSHTGRGGLRAHRVSVSRWGFCSSLPCNTQTSVRGIFRFISCFFNTSVRPTFCLLFLLFCIRLAVNTFIHFFVLIFFPQHSITHEQALAIWLTLRTIQSLSQPRQL